MDHALRELYQEVILDHSRHPRHFGALEHATHKAEGYNPLCGDRVTVYLVLAEDGRVADIRFEGKGCAISQASASMMTRSAQAAPKPSQQADGWISASGEGRGSMWPVGGRSRNPGRDGGISEFPMRVKCATLAWHTFKNALKEGAT